VPVGVVAGAFEEDVFSCLGGFSAWALILALQRELPPELAGRACELQNVCFWGLEAPGLGELLCIASVNIPVAKSYTFCGEIRHDLLVCLLYAAASLGGSRNSDNGLGPFFVGAKFISVFNTILITTEISKRAFPRLRADPLLLLGSTVSQNSGKMLQPRL